MENKRIVFITGATGLVGSYLLKVLLENGHKVYVLARDKNNKSAQQRVTELLKFWNENVAAKYSRNCLVLKGDITQEELGLDKKTTDLLKKEVEEIFHCAAITEFSRPLDEMRKANVGGTKNVLNFSLECNNLKKVNHISTAYVCGDYKGVFKEDDLDVGQKFNTAYEQSKFEAEEIVAEYRKKGLWVDIIRLAAVVGEAHTGKIFKFKHIYELFHLWSLEVLDLFPNEDHFSIQLSCIDQVAEAMYIIFLNVKKRNENYHLFGEKGIFTKEVFYTTRKCIGFKKPILVSLNEFNVGNHSPIQKKIVKMVNLLNTPSQVNLDSSYTGSVLKKYNFEFPVFDYKHLCNIINYAINSGFIKRVL